MSIRLASSQLLPLGLVLSGFPGHGIRGDAISSVGDGASPVFNDLVLPADAAKEYRWGVITPPVVGVLETFEDCSYVYTPPVGTSNLTVNFTYRLWEDCVDVGTAVETIIIGVGSGNVYVGTVGGAAVQTSINAAGGIYTSPGIAVYAGGVDGALLTPVFPGTVGVYTAAAQIPQYTGGVDEAILLTSINTVLGLQGATSALTPVSFHFVLPTGEPMSDAQVEIQLSRSSYNGFDEGVIMPRPVVVRTDIDGKVVVHLWPSTTLYQVTVLDSRSEAGLSYKFLVPDVAMGTVVRLQDIIVDGATVGVAFDVATLQQIQTARAEVLAARDEVMNSMQVMNAPAPGTMFTVNLASGTLHKFTTSGNTIISLPAPLVGKRYVVMVVYGGAHSLTWIGGGNIRWAGGVAPVPSSTAGKLDIFEFTSDGVNTYGRSEGSNY